MIEYILPLAIYLFHSYAVFGLGSTAYEHFCAYGKRLDLLLQDLGGTRQELVHNYVTA